MKLYTALILTVCLVVLLGCDQACRPADVPGDYQMRSGRDDYQLRLSANGTGTFLRNQRTVEALSWEFEPVNGQVFLHVSRDLIDQMKMLAGEPKTSKEGAPWKSGYHGVTPVCTRAGPATRIDLDVDGDHYLSRID